MFSPAIQNLSVYPQGLEKTKTLIGDTVSSKLAYGIYIYAFKMHDGHRNTFSRRVETCSDLNFNVMVSARIEI